MGMRVRLMSLAELDEDAREVVRGFALAKGRLGGGQRVHAEWWREAERARETASRFAFDAAYESPERYALESLLDAELGLARWRSTGRRVPERLFVAPFLFDVQPPTWVELAIPNGNVMLVGHAVVLMEDWPGVFDDPGGRAYAARAEQALEGARTTGWPTPEERAEAAALAIGLCLFELAWQGWERRLFVSIAF